MDARARPRLTSTPSRPEVVDPPVARALAILALVCALGSSPPSAWAAQGALTATIGPGFDSNPLRIVGVASLPDGFFGLSMSGRGRLDLSDDQQLQGRYDLGARLFLRGKDELAVQQLEIDWALQLGRLLLGAEVAAKWRLSHAATEATNRDYADGTAELFADWAFTREVSRTWKGSVIISKSKCSSILMKLSADT